MFVSAVGCSSSSRETLCAKKGVTHRYAETNVLELQFPFVKTVKPLVRRMMMHMKRAKYEEYTIRVDMLEK